MSLYEKWQDIAGEERTHQDQDSFWKTYFEKEMNIYQKILAEKNNKLTGVLSELASSNNMSAEMFTGFIDGINTSLESLVDLDSLEESSNIDLNIDFEKLYFNMLDAKAEWLYNLTEWEDVLPADRRSEITKEFKSSKIAVSEKIGRNDPCICGSGKKYKKCCGT